MRNIAPSFAVSASLPAALLLCLAIVASLMAKYKLLDLNWKEFE
jgi:hypothetical protein